MGVSQRWFAVLAVVLALLVPPVTVVAQAPSGAEALKGATWGAPTRTPESAFTRTGAVAPATAAEAVADVPAYYRDGCHVTRAGTEPIGCVYGDPLGAVDVVVVGDSKVGQWFAALDEIARREGWRLTVYTKSSCSFVPHRPVAGYAACDTYNARLLGFLRSSPPQMIVVSGQRQGVAGDYASVWQDLRDRGVDRIAALWDSPDPSLLGAECVEPLVPSGDYVRSCSYTQGTASGSATLESAAARVAGAEFIEMGDWVCPPSTLSPACPSVIGGAVVYAGGTHLTETYVRSMVDPLHERLYRAGIASVPPEPERVQRVGGADRYETAALLANHPVGGRVYVATGEMFPDALTAAAAAGTAAAPVLLTRAGNLPQATRDALTRLRPSEITVVGGSGVVTQDVLEALGPYTAGPVTRVSGPTRYGTAAAVARGSEPPSPTVYVATGAAFPDALAAAARAGLDDVPVLLTTGEQVPPETVEVLRDLQPDSITVVGGAGVVGDRVVQELNDLTGTVTRVTGVDRYGTAAALSQRYPARVPVAYVASGATFPDALAAAARAGHEGAPVLLVRPDSVPPATAAALERLAPQTIVVVGAGGAVSDTVRWGLERYLRR